MSEAKQISDEQLLESLKLCTFGDPITGRSRAYDKATKPTTPKGNLKFSAHTLAHTLKGSLHLPR